MNNLRVNPDVLLAPVRGGYVAFNVAEGRLYRLNPVAALLVELCDGSRPPGEVVSLARPLIPQCAEADLAAWLNRAAADGVLVDAAGASAGGRAISLDAEALTELADRLREDGKVREAALCQQRAAELSPETPGYWSELGELSHIVGDREAAKNAYLRYLELEPGDAEVRHILVALRDEPAPARTPDECIRQLYERFSAYYESNMCNELGYDGPGRLMKVVRSGLGERHGLTALDLGCGTGLAGELLRPAASRLVGVDLSEGMLAGAERGGLYDDLQLAEVTEWLGRPGESFDLIVACDTFIYFGDLRQVIGPAAARLNPGGAIAFSVERAAAPPFRLTDSGRYEHHRDHIGEAAAAAGLRVAAEREAFLRMEYGDPVTAHYVCLTRGAGPAT